MARVMQGVRLDDLIVSSGFKFCKFMKKCQNNAALIWYLTKCYLVKFLFLCNNITQKFGSIGELGGGRCQVLKSSHKH